MSNFAIARILALGVPAALMLGALTSQYVGGLPPCEMCHWQRWPHDVAIVLALFAFALRAPGIQKAAVMLAAFAVAISGAIGVFHAGVEYGWWEGLTRCAVMPGRGGADIMADIMKTPLIRCDSAPWSLFGISLAGYNAMFSLGGVAFIFGLLRRA